MNTGPAVIVNKSGALASLIKGLFSAVIVLLICGTALGLYGLHVADKFVGGTALSTFRNIPELVRSLPDWRQFPPIIAEPLNDRRALDYAERLEVKTHYRPVAQSKSGEVGVVEVTVTNTGTEVVSMATLRLLVEDDSSQAFDQLYSLATPVAFEGTCWNGPLPPGATRRLVQGLVAIQGQPRITAELSDLRVWQGPPTVSPVSQPEAQPAMVPSAASATADDAS